MSDTKHTPGTWRVGCHAGAIITDCPAPDDCDSCTPAQTAFYGGHVICESAAERDKPILAAAPDLLAALEEGCDFHHLPLHNGWAHNVDGKVVRCRLSENARAALAKVKP